MEDEKEIDEVLKKKYWDILKNQYTQMSNLLKYDEGLGEIVTVGDTLVKYTLETALPGVVNDLINERVARWKFRNLKDPPPNKAEKTS